MCHGHPSHYTGHPRLKKTKNIHDRTRRWHICRYACMHLNMHVFIHIYETCVYVGMPANLRVCGHDTVCIYAFMHACVYTCHHEDHTGEVASCRYGVSCREALSCRYVASRREVAICQSSCPTDIRTPVEKCNNTVLRTPGSHTSTTLNWCHCGKLVLAPGGHDCVHAIHARSFDQSCNTHPSFAHFRGNS